MAFKEKITLVVLFLTVTSHQVHGLEPHEVAEVVEEAMTGLNDQIAEANRLMADQLDQYRSVVKDLARQTMLLQFGMEERVRSDGDSGIKIVRGLEKGPDNYYEHGLMGNSFNSIHDHSNFDSTVGMGEVIAVLNGVEFRTRHNDYKLKMPSTTSTEYHAVEDVPRPEVPDAVTRLATVDEQITEMREWFKAFHTQNVTHRNYPAHFKPILCYMEGAWTLDKDLDEPFASDRHQIDADSWFDLQEKVRFTSYTGSKSRLENFAYLPTTVISVNDTTGVPTYAQWNYRILCSPLKEDVALSDFRRTDDLAHRVPRRKSREDMTYSRAARFRLYESEKDRFQKYSKIDRLFYSIPGKDNIPPSNMSQISFGDVMFDMGHEEDVPLNTGYYHRFFRFSKSGAMGLKDTARGFNDANLWVAQTDQARVAPVALERCESKKIPFPDGKLRWRKVCENVLSRFSYAIPLEIIYLTPLQTWNPYNIETGKETADVVTGGRNGVFKQEKAYNGTDSSKFYITPVEFFKGGIVGSDPADTVRGSVGVLDKKGVLRKTTASGVKVILQEIEGVGRVRLRYPIAPVHGEGSAVWKELNALKKVVRDQEEVDSE